MSRGAGAAAAGARGIGELGSSGSVGRRVAGPAGVRIGMLGAGVFCSGEPAGARSNTGVPNAIVGERGAGPGVALVPAGGVAVFSPAAGVVAATTRAGGVSADAGVAIGALLRMLST